ncbi:hypothetical protein CCR75_005348 [Bremia lactucae]|uniref:Chitinase II/V-like catalytic domain-containing protein n=1 Tax=Bremia lactucae TaxID=4779 RepID=A0A976FIV4_BRELC|nr:hypothetical protein CCR75_005348 [Bremia lactucae]
MHTTVLMAGFLVLLFKMDRKALAWDKEYDRDEVEGDDDDSFDFVTSKLEFIKNEDIVEVECDSQQCAANAANGVPSVFVRGLVTTKPKPKLILQEHARAATNIEKQFKGETLGYVTPWNNRGYEWAKKFRAKLTYISPVWLQVREDTHRAPIITGLHDIDRQWMRDIRDEIKGNIVPAIVPRIVYERNRLSSEDVSVIIDDILALMDEHDFDGIVFEIPVMAGTVDMLQQIARACQNADKLLILVLSRSSKEGELSVKHNIFADLAPLVHRFSLNAYDYSAPGPTAPYLWLKKTLETMLPIERQKVLMGLPMSNTESITGSTYIQSISDNDVSNIQWNAETHECQHAYTATKSGGHHEVFYPCLQFLQDRLQLFEEYHVGAAIWELGQGTLINYDTFSNTPLTQKCRS